MKWKIVSIFLCVFCMVTLLGTCFASKDFNSSPNVIESFKVNSDTNETNVIMFYDNSQKKIYFSLKTKKDIPNKSSSILSVDNKFKIVNNAGMTTHDIGVTFYQMVSGFHVKGSSSTRYNLVNGGVLNYDPSPEITHVTLAINVEEKWPGDPRIDIYKLIIPLRGWHTASILKENDGYYLKFI